MHPDFIPHPDFESIFRDFQNRICERLAIAADDLRSIDKNDLLHNDKISFIQGYEQACVDLAKICRALKS